MTELFPGDPLPDIFTPPAQVQASTAVLPIEVRVHYGSGPLMAAGAGLLALLAAGAARPMAGCVRAARSSPSKTNSAPCMRVPVRCNRFTTRRAMKWPA
jgi:hypothetical protein